MILGVFSRIREFWHWLTANKYVQMLEAEIERLRAENRALMNSILGIAGVPPVISAPAATPTPSSSSQSAATGAVKASGNGSSVAPLRRRSWQQVNRTLENEAARKKDSDGKTTG